MMINFFYEIEQHLLNDEAPSHYLNHISGLPFFKEFPYTLLHKLKETEQSPMHHPEGNVWRHTMLVLDQAAAIKGKSRNPKVLMWAALLHDIGKPDTTKTHKGKITSYDHDKAGSKLARKFLENLTNETGFIEETAMLVRWHMQMLFVVKHMPFGDIEAMRSQTDIQEVALLGFCDRMGRLHADRYEEEKNMAYFLKHCL